MVPHNNFGVLYSETVLVNFVEIDHHLGIALRYFVLVFFSPFSIAIALLWEEKANRSAFRTFVRFAFVWFCIFSLPLGVFCGLSLWHSPDFSLTFFLYCPTLRNGILKLKESWGAFKDRKKRRPYQRLFIYTSKTMNDLAPDYMCYITAV